MLWDEKKWINGKIEGNKSEYCSEITLLPLPQHTVPVTEEKKTKEIY